MDDVEKEEIRARVDLVELVAQYTPVKQAGKRFKACCPFHQEKTPSFTIDPELGRWRCFGACSTGGDIFGFLMKAENLSFPDAVERLAQRAGITLKGRGGDTEASRKAAIERDRVLAANAAAQKFFRETFARAGLARDYAQKRGLTHEIIEAFGVGFAPDDWSQLAGFLHRNGVKLEDAEKAGLVFSRNFPAHGAADEIAARWTDKFRGRLMFPILDVQDRTVGFGGRLLVPSENAPKYLNSPETPVFSKSKILYGLNRARKAIGARDLALLVEGYMDVVACHQAGLEFAVATLGTSLTDDHVRLLRRYTKNVTLSFDADEAGVRAALRAAELFKSHGDDWTLRVLSLPPGEDPDSLLQKGEVAKFRKAIDVALTVPEFRIKTLLARFDTRAEEGKMAFLREAIPVIAGVESAIEQDVLVRRLAAYHPAFASGGSRAEESLRSEVQRWRRSGAGQASAASDRAASAQNAAPSYRPVYQSPASPSPGQPAPNPNNANFVPLDADGVPLTDADAPPLSPDDPPQTPLRGDTILPRGSRQGMRPPPANGSGPPPSSTAGGRGSAAFAPPGHAPQMTPPARPARTAGQIAEETIQRALLDDEWSHLIARYVRPDLFTDPRTVALLDALLPLLTGHITPADAVSQLTDPALIDHAMTLQVALSEEPLTDQGLADCLETLQKRREREKLRQIEASIVENAQNAQNGEGMPLSNDELLRRWEERARAIKQPRRTGENSG